MSQLVMWALLLAGMGGALTLALWIGAWLDRVLPGEEPPAEEHIEPRVWRGWGP